MEARQLPEIFDELACYLLSPAHTSRSTLSERLPEDPVEAPLAALVMETLDLVTELALESFGHELFDAGAVGQKHFGFHPTASLAQVAQRFEKDGFRVLHAADLVRNALAPSGDEGTRQRVRALPRTGLSDREAALLEYVRAGGPMPPAGADHAGIALRLGELLSPRPDEQSEADERILDVACAAGELRGVFTPIAARLNAHDEATVDTFGWLRRELSRRGIAEGRILVAMLRSGIEVSSSASAWVMCRYGQLDAMIEAVRGSEPSRAEQPKLITKLLTWASCVGAFPAAVQAVIDLVDTPRGRDLLTDDLRAHLTAAHAWEGPKSRGRAAKAAPAKAAPAKPAAVEAPAEPAKTEATLVKLVAHEAPAEAPKADKPARAKKSEKTAEPPKTELPKTEPEKAVEKAAEKAPEAPKAEPEKAVEKAVEKAAEKPPEAPKTEAAPEPAEETGAPKRAKKSGAAPTLTSLNETATFAQGDGLVTFAEPGFEGDDEALLDAVNRKVAVAFRADLSRPVTVRVTGRGLTAHEADHAFGSHHFYAVKSGADAFELRVGSEGRALALPKGKYGVEVVAIRSPRPGAVPDYVLLVRPEAPAKMPKRTELGVIPTG